MITLARVILRKTVYLALVAGSMISPAFADEACTISSDVTRYYQRLDMAHILTQYQGVVVRATEGKIRCEEDSANGRLVCAVDGQGELLVDSAKGAYLVNLTSAQPGKLHVYPGGDLSCGLASEL